MAVVSPLTGLRYDPARVGDLGRVLAPPYDVISAAEQAELYARSPYNVIRLILPREPDRAGAAARTLRDWITARVLVPDPEPAIYLYSQRFTLPDGSARRRDGIICRLRLEDFSSGVVRPHERTLPGPKADRLAILRATGANLSAIFGLYARRSEPVRELLGAAALGPPLVDVDGWHLLWRVTDRATIARVEAALARETIIIADGHHRYETALAYRDEQRAAGAAAGPHDLLMAYIVELADEQLTVRAIHRLVSGLPANLDLVDALSPFFDPFEAGPVSGAASLPARMVDAGALALIRRDQTWLLRPRPDAFTDGVDAALDSSRLAAALDALPDHNIAYQHGVDAVVAAVEKGDAQAGFLLRPATVAQIAAAARARRRMPAKTTFFYPKPRTGLVFRRLGP